MPKKLYLLKKRYLVLLELMISLGLVMILMSSLLFLYHQITLVNTQLDKIQRDNFQMRYLENRLSEILPKALGPVKKGSKRYFYFFTTQDPGGIFKGGNPSLIFTYDNCVNLGKPFSERVVGRIYIDESSRLMLGTWPSPRYWQEDKLPPMKKEVLLENVNTLEFEFFIAPKKEWKPLKEERKSKDSIPEGYWGTWVKDWLPEYNQLPEMVRLKMTHTQGDKEETTRFIFPIPKSEQPIIYDR